GAAGDFQHPLQVAVGGQAHLEAIIAGGGGTALEQVELGQVQHLDEPKADVLEQHRFAQLVVFQAAADEAASGGVPRRFQAADIARGRLPANIELGDLQHRVSVDGGVPGSL